jgi:uncharacterized membrane protein YfcA
VLHVDWLGMLAVVGAGLGAGVVITAIGAGSLVSFPILLAVGVSPLVANVSNTVGLVPGGVTGTWGYRSEMAGYPHLVRRVALTSVVGALAGAVLLLAFPPGAFEAVVPYLVLFAATLVGIQPFVSVALRRRAQRRGLVVATDRETMGPRLTAASSVVGVYGGYFGAGQGVMLVAFLALGLDVPLQAINALKNLAILAANVAATVVFVFAAPLDWTVVGLIALGSLVGGWVGAHLGRRLPPTVFRVLVVLFGYVVAIRLLVG